MTYVIRPAVPADAGRIATLLRKQDRIECIAASGQPPEVGLPAAFSVLGHDIIFAETKNGDPILIAGTSPFPGPPGIGVIWMLATPLLERFPKSFIREGKAWIEKQHDKYPALCNWTWAENDLHVRFLRFMGFAFGKPVQVRGTTFLPFERHRQCATPL
jgi:hypothetical protein